MLSFRIRDGVYGLDDESASELARRVGEGESDSLVDKLREGDPIDLDGTEIVIVGIVLEAWLVEADGDLPGDVEELRQAIAAALRDAS